MIGLGDFILYYNIQQDDPMYQHLCIEYDNLYENKGIPNGLRHDITFISDLIHKELKIKDNDFFINIQLSKLETTGIFDSLKIDCKFVDETSGEGSTNFNEKFDKNFIITLFINEETPYINIKRRIGHELLHCVDYVKSQEQYTSYDYDNKSFFFKRLTDISYKELFKDKNNFADYFTKLLLYYSNKDELNAFITEITIEIEHEKPKDQNEAYKLLMKNEMYLNYMALYNALHGKEIKQYKSEICNIYRTLVKSDKNYSEGQIFRKFKNRFDDIQKRLLKIIPKICYENQSFELRSGRGYMNIFKEVSEKYNKIF